MSAPTGELAPPARHALVALSAAVAAGDERSITLAARAADRYAPHGAVEESLLQSYLFLGFPAALAALFIWRRVTESAPQAEAAGEVDDVDRWVVRGSEVCRTVYGRAYEKLRANVRRVHPAMDRWMIQEGYGKVLGRPGLDLGTRELCIVAILAATGWEAQLHSHLRGALNAGCTSGEIEEALEEGLALARDEGWVGRARRLWNRVRDRVRETPGG